MKTDISPEGTMRSVMDTCADCDACRFLMDESCPFFPELYRLADRKDEGGEPASEAELRELARKCTLCDLCPCPNIRGDIVAAKTAFARRQGLPLGSRLLADIQGEARGRPRGRPCLPLGSRFLADIQGLGELSSRTPRLVNQLLNLPLVEPLLKKCAGVHPSRTLPGMPRESFFRWARRKGLDRKSESQPGVAYFAGCTAGYFFPEVARAAVTVLEHSGVPVHVPPQQCCGMPTLVEGEKPRTMERVRFNLETLLARAREGYTPVCSCPTCGFLFKVLLHEDAVYSRAYQESLGAGPGEIRIPRDRGGRTEHVSLNKALYSRLSEHEEYFSELDPLDRVALSSRVRDLGQYLEELREQGRLKAPTRRVEMRVAYFAPCHQREQNTGTPYATILSLVPGLRVEQVGGRLDCCGMGGSLGMKKDFSRESVRIGEALMDKIRASSPEAVVTDCLSCRLQLEHLLPFPVFHPLEMLSRSYEA